MTQEQSGPSLATRIERLGGILLLMSPVILLMLLAITVTQIAKK